MESEKVLLRPAQGMRGYCIKRGEPTDQQEF